MAKKVKNGKNEKNEAVMVTEQPVTVASKAVEDTSAETASEIATEASAEEEKKEPEKNKVVRAKKVKGLKKAKKPKLPKQKRETRSAKKQRIAYEKALKKTSAERTLSLIAIGLALVSAILSAISESSGKEE